MYRKGTKVFKHHVSTYGPHNKFGYKVFIPTFKAEKFDPDQWGKFCKEAGGKYVVPVAAHHDGFAMYQTKLFKWNSFNMGTRKDIIGELSKSIRKQGRVFEVSSHGAGHWFYFTKAV